MTALQYAHIGGEISSLSETLKQVEKDLREYKDINKRYTDQLVKVKVGYWLALQLFRTVYSRVCCRCPIWRTMISRSTRRP